LEQREHFYRVQKINLQNELTLLKNQISPHFLFNTLNNANILIETDPQRASSMVLNLSDLLRYQIYDCSEESVLLNSDIDFLQNFLKLEQSKRDDFEFTLQKEGCSPTLFIPPLLFIPFVENAVKHSVYDGKTNIDIQFKMQEDELIFICINTKLKENLPPSKHSGIGLSNIRRRLELLFEKKYNLRIEDRGSVFFVELKLSLK